ncbi:ARMADILLO BTB ARABIDOPSIS PROTEIN 1-like [Thrips palmi]|uniref:ARMADILLO BTB ARABIDOPSIS PROTEIN 1-like n=1 Tax=Thrips palmi TaxID=161013 RepID=A0A6P8YM55_THRPL|nr:ARMADILLO BTB ARABIDOPSIS PROTEIN 1-like [Thrips palmi]
MAEHSKATFVDHWEPIIAADCPVPWDTIRKLGPRQQQDFFGPFSVHDNEHEKLPSNELFRVLFDTTAHGKILVFVQPRLGLTRELCVSALSNVIERKRIDEAPSQKSTSSQLPLNSITSIKIPVTHDSKTWKIFEYPSSMMRSFRLKLRVYAQKTLPGDSIISFLNSRRILDSTTFCDIQLQVDGQNFPAHKAVLCVKSCVFMAMFTGDFKEKTSDTVLFEGVSKEAFGRFLDYLYTEKLEGDYKTYILELLNLSERFQVARLKAECEMRLWMSSGPTALSLLLEVDEWPVVTADLKNRLCQVVAEEWCSVENTDIWRLLQVSNPVAAGFIQAFALAPVVAPPAFKCFNAVPVPTPEIGKASRKRPASS